MNTLTPRQLEEVRSELLRTLAKLQKSAQSSAERAVNLDQSTVGRLSRIDAIQNQGLTNSLKDREQTKLTMITEALRRIEAGTYGVCSTCASIIQFERLLIFPETTVCTPCGLGS